MNETVSSFTETPREITQTLKRLSIAAETLGTVAGYFFSWPVDPDNYNIPPWIAPLEPIEVQDAKTVLCKTPDLGFFVNLYFMRWGEIHIGRKNGALIFVLVNNENSDQTRGSLINVINKTIDRKSKPPQSLEDLNRAIHRECRDPSLCVYSIRKEDPLGESVQYVEVTVSYGEQTPAVLIQAFQG